MIYAYKLILWYYFLKSCTGSRSRFSRVLAMLHGSDVTAVGFYSRICIDFPFWFSNLKVFCLCGTLVLRWSNLWFDLRLPFRIIDSQIRGAGVVPHSWNHVKPTHSKHDFTFCIFFSPIADSPLSNLKRVIRSRSAKVQTAAAIRALPWAHRHRFDIAWSMDSNINAAVLLALGTIVFCHHLKDARRTVVVYVQTLHIFTSFSSISGKSSESKRHCGKGLTTHCWKIATSQPFPVYDFFPVPFAFLVFAWVTQSACHISDDSYFVEVRCS